MGKILTIILAVCAIGGGILMYYQQVYAYYYEVEPNGTSDVQMTSLSSGAPEAVEYDAFEAIDADSSPIRYRACFTTRLSLESASDAYVADQTGVPLTAPGWFECFDAKQIGAEIEEGRARAYLGTENIRYGIDRVVAIHEDGRGWVWDQINRCGEIVFDGQPAPDDCPPAPEGY
ncbi:histidine kinase [Pelagivirga sediminicola]|uniref:Histidine kinase n=1 Tax=Pelagivirga sediminicola TaxID=2170575 RepID=A0A2T7G6K6_9RHOB|nr:DUF6446 family protein [Pelagivirga sediminicola]PVA10064.1 histidine kinase [Pelagivirga sediminicola]